MFILTHQNNFNYCIMSYIQCTQEPYGISTNGNNNHVSDYGSLKVLLFNTQFEDSEGNSFVTGMLQLHFAFHPCINLYN